MESYRIDRTVLTAPKMQAGATEDRHTASVEAGTVSGRFAEQIIK